MSRRSNLNTLRRYFDWDSNWTSSINNYTQLVWFDIKITAFLNGLFYMLRMPSSSYLIRRFLNSFAIIETDVWLFYRTRMSKFLPNCHYISYVVYKLRKLWRRKRKYSRVRKWLQKYTRFSIYGIVSYLCNMASSFLRNKRVRRKKKHTVSKDELDTLRRRKYDARTLKQKREFHTVRDAERFSSARTHYVNKSYIASVSSAARSLPWVTNANVSMLRFKRRRVMADSSVRYVFHARKFYTSYFGTRMHKKIGAFLRWVRLRKLTILPYDISSIHNLLLLRSRYSRIFKRIFFSNKHTYKSRRAYSINTSFRSLVFNAKISMRRAIICRLRTGYKSTRTASNSGVCMFVLKPQRLKFARYAYNKTTHVL